MTVFWPAFIGGVVLLIAGVLIFLKSGSIATGMRSMSGRVPGREAFDGSYTTRNARITGVAFALGGVLAIILSLLDLNW
ncbi:hypothetical protein [Frigoribacterium sp. RIT-PI-h]|uniref:hypothetical protein n=1 Tax=Frigoribacterium sp. RIT-PI-h TaxID=1690245 RepID=UPI0006B9F539|nr:hypothetical protein [Frigoribacterium sp. RIT-PI-h]KPG82341.1 hypothetical protein AEQ27_09485 [Frigoribacterium sp. RIT-PI-h]